MPALPPLLVWLALTSAADPALAPGPGTVPGFRPTGSLDELVDLGLLARLRDPRVRPIAIESTARADSATAPPGGAPRARGRAGDGPGSAAEVCIAELAGPGIIQRIWLGEPDGLPDQGERARDRLKVYLEGRIPPTLDLSLEDLADGRHPQFPRPLAGSTGTGVYSYRPIAFRAGCRIVLEGPWAGRRPFQVGGVALADTAGLAPFPEEPSSGERAELARVAAFWSRPEEPAAPEGVTAETSEYVVDGIARNTHRFLLPAGPRTIRTLEVQPGSGTSDAWRSARLRLVWDGEDRAPAVDLPLAFAFGFALVPGSEPGRSLLMEATRSTWTNRFPMPYRREAFLQLDAGSAIQGTIRIRSVRGVAPDAAYFHASCRDAAATSGAAPVAAAAIDRTGRGRGRGHYAGILIATRGSAPPPARAEDHEPIIGDLRWINPGLGSESPALRSARPSGRDAAPAHGLLRGVDEPLQRPAAAYRWHAVDPIPFARPLRPFRERDNSAPGPADPHRAVAVFWYSERPGPEPAGP